MTPALAHFDQAQLLQWQWKTEAMLRLAVAVVRLALRLDEFAADDLDVELDHGGTGICGSVFARLEQNGIIARVGIWSKPPSSDLSPPVFYGKERASRRPGRKAAKLKVYALRDGAKARAWLNSAHQVSEPFQLELV